MSVGVGAWLVLAAAALIVGVSKTSISGLGSLVVALFALVMPAKESTAAVLLLLICGDVVAVIIYHRQADWSQLKRLLPAVVPGILLGAVFMRYVSDRTLLIAVAACLIVAVGLQVGLRARDHRRSLAASRALVTHRTTTVPDRATATPGIPVSSASGIPPVPPVSSASSASPASSSRTTLAGAIAAGAAAGFTTMVANAAGAVMSLYLLAIRADKTRFVATGAWFFFLVNLAKVPFSVGLGLIHADTLPLLATLIPVVLLGAGLGRLFLSHLKQNRFEWLVLLASAVSAVVVLLKALV